MYICGMVILGNMFLGTCVYMWYGGFWYFFKKEICIYRWYDGFGYFFERQGVCIGGMVVLGNNF